MRWRSEFGRAGKGGRRALAGGLLGLAFAALFAAACYLWWGAVLVALTPLALLQAGTRRQWVGALSVTFFAAATWAGTYYYFGFYSVRGLAFWALLNGAVTGAAMAWAEGCRRRWGLPLTLLLPVAWVTGEFIRMSGQAGLPVGLLAPVCREQLWMIQVADLAGVFGLSFALAMVSGLAADAVLLAAPAAAVGGEGWRVKGGRFLVPAAATGAVWVFIATYGWWRLAEAEETMSAGPAVTVVQPDVPTSAGVRIGFDPDRYLEEMMERSAGAVAESEGGDGGGTELILWPEAMSTMPPLNRDFLAEAARWTGAAGAAVEPAGGGGAAAVTVDARRAFRMRSALGHDRRLRSFAGRSGIPLLLGCRTQPVAEAGAGTGAEDGAEGGAATRGVEWFNAAIHYLPGGEGGGGGPWPPQNKMRLMPVGEARPWAGTWLGRLVEGWVLAPGERERRWLTPGRERRIYTLSRAADGPPAPSARYVVTLCSEIMHADSSGVFLGGAAGGKPFDFIANLANLGGFRRNHVLPIQNYLLPFRAVEARVGVARCSNTGISCFVKPTGELYGAVKNGRGEAWTGKGAPDLAAIAKLIEWRLGNGEALARDPGLRAELGRRIAAIEALRAEVGVAGASTQTVFLDSRRTPYSRWGDRFARAVAVAFVALPAALFCAGGLRRERPRFFGCAPGRSLSGGWATLSLPLLRPRPPARRG